MKDIFQVIFGTLRAKVIKLYTKLRLFTSPSYLKALWTGKLREFFSNLLDVKPKSKEDYYGVGRWLIGKKLAFAIVIILGAVSLWYIYSLLPVEAIIKGAVQPNSNLPTYRYNSMALKHYTGTARVVARKKYVAYQGQINEGLVAGRGTLFNAQGGVVYTGEFANNMYNGKGKFYYDNSDIKYEGQFKDNLFNGEGTLYNKGGIPAYVGNFENNEKQGSGQIFDGVGRPVFQGRFYQGKPVFSDFLGKPTAEMGAAFQAKNQVFNSGDVACVGYPNLGLLFETKGNPEALEDSRRANSLYNLKDKFMDGDRPLLTKGDLDDFFGQPLYQGNTFATFPEVSAISLLHEMGSKAFGDMEETKYESAFDGVYNLVSYDTTYEIYICTYLSNDLVYTFYFEDKDGEYLMYGTELPE